MLQLCHDTSWIAAETAEVVAIYRSTAPQPLPGGLADLPTVQAFAVVTGSNGRQQVFASLYLKELKRGLVYAVRDPQQPDVPPDTLLQQVLSRFAAQGFHLDPVNLKYGAAMREVVVRDIPVIASPETLRNATQQQAALQAELNEQAAGAEEDADPPSLEELPPARRAALDLARKERLGLARAALRKLDEQRTSAQLLERVDRVFTGSPDEVSDHAAIPLLPTTPATEMVPAGGDFAVAEQEVDELETATRQAAALMAAERADRERLAGEKELLEQRAVALAEAARKAASKAQAEQAEVARLKTCQAEAEAQARTAAERASAYQQAEQAATREKERLAQEKTAAERRASQLACDVAAAVERAARDRAERDRLAAEKLTAEEESGRLTATLRQVEERLERERLIREQLVGERAEAERRLEALGETVRQAEAQIAAEKMEREELALERAERQRLEAEKAALEKCAADLAKAQAAAEKTGQEKLIREQVERQRLAGEKLALERAERQRLAEEKASLEKRVAELAEAQAALEETEREKLALEQAERQRLAEEKTALEKQAAELADVAREAVKKAKAERWARERLEVENLERETLLAEKKRLEQQAAELERVARMAVDKAERERREREQLMAAKTQAEERLAALQRQSVAPVATTGSVAQGLPRFSLEGGDPKPVQKRRGSVAGAFFLGDLELEGIPCDPFREVLDVQQSINFTQLALEGFPNQYTSAWIVGLRSGSIRTVRVVFRLSDSRRTLVYLPAREPKNSEGYARAQQEALKFLRVAGLEMERMPLGTTPQERARALAALPIFLPIAGQAEG
jgi:hypothetical protein